MNAGGSGVRWRDLEWALPLWTTADSPDGTRQLPTMVARLAVSENSDQVCHRDGPLRVRLGPSGGAFGRSAVRGQADEIRQKADVRALTSGAEGRADHLVGTSGRELWPSLLKKSGLSIFLQLLF